MSQGPEAVPFTEPDDGRPVEPPAETPPGKLDAIINFYGFLEHLHGEITVALDQLELFVPEHERAGAVGRARDRLATMGFNPDWLPTRLPGRTVTKGRPEA